MVLLQQVIRALTGQDSPFAIVISTLVIATLLNPLRGWVQEAIDRRLCRCKYDARLALVASAVTTRDEVEMSQSEAELLLLLVETMQPENLSLWLKDAVDPIQNTHF